VHSRCEEEGKGWVSSGGSGVRGYMCLTLTLNPTLLCNNRMNVHVCPNRCSTMPSWKEGSRALDGDRVRVLEEVPDGHLPPFLRVEFVLQEVGESTGLNFVSPPSRLLQRCTQGVTRTCCFVPYSCP
jgi:hypothetical protein